MRTIKKVIASLLAAALVLTLAACGSDGDGENSSSVTDSGEQIAANNQRDSNGGSYHALTIGSGTATSTLTPFGTFSAGVAEKAIYEQLATLDGVGGTLTGIIAKEWHTIDDGTTWDVTIYDNVYDSQGNHITAEDVNYCCNDRIGIAYMAKCAACEVVGDYTVRITLTNNGLGTLNAVMNGFNIVSKAAYEASPDGMATSPVGTGPYIVTDFVAGGYVTVVKNENYWQKDESLRSIYAQATVDELTVVTIQEATQQTIALETGTIDCMNVITSTEVDKFEAGGEYADDFTVTPAPLQQFYMTSFSGDETSATGNDLNLRLAIAYAIDTDGLIAGAMDGRATAIKYLGMPSFPDNPSEPDSYFEYNPELAKEYLAKSNYKGQTIRIVCQNSGSYAKICQIIENYLEAVGITAEVNAYDNAMWQTAYADPTQYDMVVCQIGSSDYLVAAWQTPFSTITSTGKSKAGWDDPELKGLIAAVLQEETHTQENMDKLQQLVNDNMYALAYFYTYSYNVWNNNTNIVSVPIGCKAELIWWCAEFAD